ncbi:MAG: T9SS type A sorting domain-containing protein [Bacteroidota bacterium]|nr:T9SS type A sorting domain-containing protein [Bacteroidota bacterium]
MKKIFFILIACLLYSKNNTAQVLFSNSCGNLILQTYTLGNTTTQYTTVPSLFSTIEDGHDNNIGITANPNKPFNVPTLKNKGWAISYNSQDNDTFFVSTSWLDTNTLAVNRWLITPQITGIVPNTVLTWYAKSPDPANSDVYEVYGTNKTGTLTSADFTLGDRLFSIANYSTTTGGENNVWTRRSVNLSSFVGQNLRFAFKNYSTNKYQLWIDDIQVITLTNNLDVSIGNLKTDKYILTNTQKTIKLNYTNLGANSISTLALNYKIGNGSIQSETVTLLNPLNYQETNTYTFSLPYSVSSPGLYPLKCWVNTVNGIADESQANDTIIMNITVQNSSPKKHVLVEQFVSANDGESCDAQSKLLALKNDSTIIGVNVHYLDSLNENTSLGVIYGYYKSFATAMFNRSFDDSLNDISLARSYYNNRIQSQLNMVTPASISIINQSYNASAKTLTFTVKADFVGEVKGDYRLNAYLVENNVSGKANDSTINGFNQLNNYYNVPWSPYYNLGYYSNFSNTNVLNAWQYKHQNVLIHSFDNSFGLSGFIPQTGGTQGQSYQKTYTLTVPTLTNGVQKYNLDNIYLVGFLAEYNFNKYQRAILNCAQTKLTTNPEVVSIKDLPNSDLSLKVFPNPSNGTLFLNGNSQISNYDIKVFDVVGNCLFIQKSYNTFLPKYIDLSTLNNGVYFLTISSSNGKSFNQKIIIQK